MIKTSAKHNTKASKSGSVVKTMNSATVPAFYGNRHNSQTISPKHRPTTAVNPSAYGKQSGPKKIHTTGGF